MIYFIDSSLETFKSFSFHKGLNVVVADKSENSGAGQTRNKAGKSSLILIVHFLLGREGEPDSLLRKNEISEFYFRMLFELRGALLLVQRSGREFGKIRIEIVDGDISDWSVNPFGNSSIISLSPSKWSEILGQVMFLIPKSAGKFGPKFGMIFNYFARKTSSGGFLDARQQSSKQSPYDVRVALSYIIGLDWHINSEREQLRQNSENIKKLQKAASDGLLEGITGNPKQLLTQVVLAKEEVSRMSEAVRSFKLLPDYSQREEQASRLTRQINELADANVQDKIYLDDLEKSLANEINIQSGDVEQLYREAGLVLPEVALRHIDEVRRFHESVVRNRKSYLAEEVSVTRANIEERSRRMKQCDDERTSIMTLLRTHGALEHYSKLQTDLNRATARAEQLKRQQEVLDEVSQKVAQFKIEEQHLYLRLQRDFKENEELLREAIIAFEKASQALYENAGNLNIFPEETGPKFEINIQGKKSNGVNQAQIFCFDMMLMQMAHRQGISPGFLIHDSSLFDPIDERQKERALEYGARLSREIGFQYIVTLNSDQFPVERVTDFPLEGYVIEPRLTDSPGGGLFGFEFN